MYILTEEEKMFLTEEEQYVELIEHNKVLNKAAAYMAGEYDPEDCEERILLDEYIDAFFDIGSPTED